MSKKNFTMYLEKDAVELAKKHVKKNGGSLGGAVSIALKNQYREEKDDTLLSRSEVVDVFNQCLENTKRG